MYRFALPALILLSACNEGGLTLYNPFNGRAVANVDPQGFAERRGQVEIAVKSRFDDVLRDISTAGGPALTAAMDAAEIADEDRPARIALLQANLEIYRTNPDALISALVPIGSQGS